MLANIYLHYVLDLWVDQWRKKCAKGEVIIVRYADDFVIGFQYREDAPVPDQGKWLRSVIQGFFNHHAVPGNRDALDAFRTLLARSWFQSLRRRSQKARSLRWERMQRIIDKWLPHPRILHPYPNQRLCVTHPR